MTAFSDYLEQRVLGATLLGSVYTPVNTVYLALATSAASDGAFFQEVPGGTAYTRQRVQFGSITADGLSHRVRNVSALNYPEATTPWGGLTHCAIYDSPTGGNQLYWGPLTTVRTILTGDTFQVPAENFSVSLD